MSAPDLDEFRSLLALFRQSDLRDLWVSAQDWSVFLAKAGGSAHPQAQNPTFVTTPAVPDHVVTAPHLGIFAEMLPLHSRINTGDRIAEIHVLDERRPVLADRPGTVSASLAEIGGMVEFGQALLSIA